MTNKIHLFDCRIDEFHKDWVNFIVECGVSIDRDFVSDNFFQVTCLKCLKLKHNKLKHQLDRIENRILNIKKND